MREFDLSPPPLSPHLSFFLSLLHTHTHRAALDEFIKFLFDCLSDAQNRANSTKSNVQNACARQTQKRRVIEAQTVITQANENENYFKWAKMASAWNKIVERYY